MIPIYTKDAIDAWVNWAREPGSFLGAVLSNDLMEAVAQADAPNLAALVDIVRYLHWECPGLCHGSRNKMQIWREWGGAKAMENRRRVEHAAT